MGSSVKQYRAADVRIFGKMSARLINVEFICCSYDVRLILITLLLNETL